MAPRDRVDNMYRWGLVDWASRTGMSIASLIWTLRRPQPKGSTKRHPCYRRIFAQARPCWPHLAGIVLLSVACIPLNLLLPLPLKIVVDSYLGSQPVPAWLAAAAPHRGLSPIVLAAGLLVAVAAAMQLQALASWILQTWTGEKLVFDFRAKLFWHSQRLSLSYHERCSSSHTAYRIQHDAPAIQYVIIQGFVPLLGAAFSFTAMALVTAKLDWQLALVAVSVAPILAWLSRKASRRAHEDWHAVKEMDSSAMSVLDEVLSSVRLVKAFGREQREDERFRERSADRMRGQMKLARKQAGYNAAIGLTITAGTAAALILGAAHVRAGALSLGELLLVMSYMAQLYDPLRTMSSKLPELQAWAVSVERAFALLDETPETFDKPRARPLKRAQGSIRFENASFGYGRQENVFEGVTLDIPAGSRVGIVGRSGSGKSTLIHLLTRFYDVREGRILLDGHDLRDYRLADLRNQFAIVLQEPVLFSTTIAANIAMPKPDASDAEIEAAARAAGIHEFIAGLPDGYETEVGERGMLFSGGQRQRISVARAFLKNAPILLLDEPTSAVDTETERQMMAATAGLMRDRTTFMIAHRFSTLRDCDILLKAGDARVEVVTNHGSPEQWATPPIAVPDLLPATT
jgi:ATP-binding cassette subfamily B protein